MSYKKKISSNIEEYLKTIYILSENERLVKTTEIAKNLDIAPGSVTQMLKKLENLGFVDYSQYKGVKLTDNGLKLAKKIIRKHRLLEQFLYGILKLKKDSIHQQACEMEHSLSDDAERALCQVLKHPDKCPDDGALIPECDLNFLTCEECAKTMGEEVEKIGKRDKNLVPLIYLKDHQKGKISFIRGDYDTIREVVAMGINIGTILHVIKSNPLSGDIEVVVNNSKITISKDMACNIFVEVKENKNE
jgi:DtxR family Mn-dependent transcriptional regulator